jgi:hypothetical protein
VSWDYYTSTCEVVYAAARSDDVAKLKWLYTEQHYELDNHRYLCDHAAIGRSIVVLAWLKQQGVDVITLTKHTCNAAAANGQLSVLQYLHAEGCHVGPDVCHSAARKGDVVMLKWVHKHGCSLVHKWYSIRETAVHKHSVELIEWLIHQPGVQFTAKIVQEAAESGDRAITYKVGHFMVKACSEAANGGSYYVIQLRMLDGNHSSMTSLQGL